MQKRKVNKEYFNLMIEEAVLLLLEERFHSKKESLIRWTENKRWHTLYNTMCYLQVNKIIKLKVFFLEIINEKNKFRNN